MSKPDYIKMRDLLLRKIGPTDFDTLAMINRAECLERVAEIATRILDCPRDVDWATVPKAGIDTRPEQVVYEMSIGHVIIRDLKKALADLEEK